jgi:malonyl-CoA O-methyltransferase
MWRRISQMFRAKNHPPTLRSAEAYALWAESYPPYAHNAFMAIEQETMRALMPPLAGRSVLDLACGSGRYARFALETGARPVIGVDSSPSMLRRAHGFLRLLADMTALPLASAIFDIILCGLATGHLPPSAMRAAMREMARVIRPEGLILFSDFHPMLYLSGGRRTFTASDGRTYAVEHYPHLIADYFDAIRAAGLTITAIREPEATIDGQDIPAVLVIGCTKV